MIYEMYKKYLDKDLFEIIKYDEGANYWLIVIKIFKGNRYVKIN